MLVKYLSGYSDRRVKMADREMLVTTTENIPGKKYEIIGEVFGLTTQSKILLKILVRD